MDTHFTLLGRQDDVNAVEMGENTHRLMFGSKLVIIEGCGQAIPTDRPNEFNQALLEFL